MQGEFEYVSTTRLPFFYLCWRKVVDISFGLVGLLVLFVLLPFLALLIYFDSPGSIFFKQERVGRLGKKFYMYKFRSMCKDTERTGWVTWTSTNDSRVTGIGRILRATHLDELPQAFNVLRGEMSLIGPRPEMDEHVLELERMHSSYRRRLVIKPGLTGWSQVNYGYGCSSKDELEKLQYDLYYIDHQSFILDIHVLLKTVVEVVLCHGT